MQYPVPFDTTATFVSSLRSISLGNGQISPWEKATMSRSAFHSEFKPSSKKKNVLGKLGKKKRSVGQDQSCSQLVFTISTSFLEARITASTYELVLLSALATFQIVTRLSATAWAVESLAFVATQFSTFCTIDTQTAIAFPTSGDLIR